MRISIFLLFVLLAAVTAKKSRSKHHNTGMQKHGPTAEDEDFAKDPKGEVMERGDDEDDDDEDVKRSKVSEISSSREALKRARAEKRRRRKQLGKNSRRKGRKDRKGKRKGKGNRNRKLIMGLKGSPYANPAQVQCDPNPSVSFAECFMGYKTWSGGRDASNVSLWLQQGLRNNDQQLFEEMCTTISTLDACMETTVSLCGLKPLTEFYQMWRSYDPLAVRFDRMCSDAALIPLYKAVLPSHNLNECSAEGSEFDSTLMKVTFPFWSKVFKFDWQRVTKESSTELCGIYEQAVEAVKMVFSDMTNNCTDLTSQTYPCGLVFSVPGRIESICQMEKCLNLSSPKPGPSNPMIKRFTVGAFGVSHLKMMGVERSQFCPRAGRVQYMTNQFFTIEGYNMVIDKKTGASVIVSLNMTFYENGSNPVATYLARGQLPDTFLDGSREITIGLSRLVIESSGPKLPMKRVMIRDTVTGMYIAFRVYKGTLSFLVRAPKWVFLSSKGLVLEGCANNEKPTQGKKKVRRDVEDQILKSCVDVCGNRYDMYTCMDRCFTENLKPVRIPEKHNMNSAASPWYKTPVETILGVFTKLRS
ncbi:uncharacterized protein LOC106164775 [Lingula anatina]|uniref:Uncharacterized protein LOC106164775 n=1 Tax=Lingula anatina TaxID=7574 RepID=A0A1S3IK44_LINAN|nr:uncharacterized protein LOC106164775 [Lingula anatina]|eukprot:XP_013398251.2 uncharacterized protein LOC106164775 [Lingula anatina]